MSILRWFKRLHWCRLRKLVTPTVASVVSLSVTQGKTGTAYNLVVVSSEDGKPDTTDTPVVTVTDPNGVTTAVQAGAPDASGTSTTAQVAGTTSGEYVYAITVGGDVQPSATFTRSNHSSLIPSIMLTNIDPVGKVSTPTQPIYGS